MSSRSLLVTLALVLATAFVGAACTATGAPTVSGRPGDAPGPAGPASGDRLLPSSPTALPTFDLATFRRLLAELRGTPVVVNIWASWCGPCRAEAPELARVARAYEGRVQFVGVDILDQRPPARAFVQEYDWPYPSVFDPQGTIRDGLGFLGQPVTVVYDARGEQAFVWSGPISGEILTAEIEKVLEA